MDVSSKTTKEIGQLGEDIAVYYLKHHEFHIRDRNMLRKTGEIDIVAQAQGILHFVEVKTILTNEFPREESPIDSYDPSINLHEAKIRKVARTGEWYVMEHEWEGEWQVDGCLV